LEQSNPPPQNKETKYSMQLLEEKSDEIANLINQHYTQEKSNEQSPQSNEDFQNSNSIDECILSMISQSFQQIHPLTEETKNYSPLEQLTILTSSLNNLIYSPQESQYPLRPCFIEILKFFDSSIKAQGLDHFQLLNLILTKSKTLNDDIYSLSKLLIGEHQQISIIDEIKPLFNTLNNEFPTKTK
jgi:hypothetical protein